MEGRVEKYIGVKVKACIISGNITLVILRFLYITEEIPNIFLKDQYNHLCLF